MNIQKQIDKEYETDLNNMFVEDFNRIMAKMYKKLRSDSIKRGIKAKRKHK